MHPTVEPTRAPHRPLLRGGEGITQHLGKETSDLIALCNKATHHSIPIPDARSLIKKTETAAKGLRAL
ncbi:hypothetical protein NGB36_23335 [Streptomyces sp. RB6PN25]|uniref:Uncharacterized protein n=1 Tax=Streptomyces humicola TaxID=2953240 RepID=A0ABT1Q0K2_9ACTN|nr:hypothetical protein [Streptomyces humicola]MCQ4083459.1 hypothetical protein [Streptomyces humicola]